MKESSFYLTIFFLIGLSCSKVSDELVYDQTPSIELLSVSNDTIIEFTESIILTFAYQDGNGDLGSTDLEKAAEYFPISVAPQNRSNEIETPFITILKP